MFTEEGSADGGSGGRAEQPLREIESKRELAMAGQAATSSGIARVRSTWSEASAIVTRDLCPADRQGAASSLPLSPFLRFA